LYSFTAGNDGDDPQGGLVRASDGYFYGSAYFGGTEGSGTIFKISTNGVFTSLYSFTNGIDNANPVATLVQGSDGRFYGTTEGGNGATGGTVFQITVMPEFQAVTLTNSTLSLTWSTEVGGTYQLQYNTNLNASNWISLSGALTATGATLGATDFVTNSAQRFYRVVVLP